MTGCDVRGRLKRRVRRVSQPGPDDRITTPGGTRSLGVTYARGQCGTRHRPGCPLPHLVHLLGTRRDIRRRLGARRDVRRRMTGCDVHGRLRRRVRRVSPPGPDDRITTPGGTRSLAVTYARGQCGTRHRPGWPLPHLVHLLGTRRDKRRRLTGRDLRGRLRRRVRRVSQPRPDDGITTPGGTRSLAVTFTRGQCGIRSGWPFPHLVHLLPPGQFAIFSPDTFVKSASQPLLTARSRASYPVRAAESPLDACLLPGQSGSKSA